MLPEVPIHNIIEPDAQRKNVQEITDMDSYLTLCKRHFPNEYSWDKEVKHHAQREIPDGAEQQYFQLLGLVAITFAQYGFPFLHGQTDRHAVKKWPTSLFHPWHQLSLLLYGANLNKQAYDMKLQVFNEISELDGMSKRAYGVWGIQRPVKGGVVVPFEKPVHELTIEAAKYKYKNKGARPILLTDVELNVPLSDVAPLFDGKKVEAATLKEFSGTIFPPVAAVTGEIVDLEPVLLRNKNGKYISIPAQQTAPNTTLP